MSKLQFPQLPLKSDSNLFVSTVIENNNQNGQDLQPRTYAIQDDIISLTDSDQEPNYTELSIDNFDEILECGDGEERLEIAVRKLHSNGLRGASRLKMSKGCEKINTLTRHPVVDDYIRNFLQVKGLSKTLEAFQIEWIESIKNGNIVVEDAISVPSVYQQNLQLLEMISNLKREVEVHKAVAQKANSKFQRLKHERDFHKMHHNRVEQEKSKMLIDIKRVKKQYEHYDPALQELKSKYATAVKERMLMKLEKDKLIKRLREVELASIPAQSNNQEISTSIVKSKKSRVERFPIEDRPNPNLALKSPKVNVDKFKPKISIQAHSLAINTLKFHPTEQLLATVSDDKMWKLWAFPSAELVMSGAGHRDWIADCDFHPSGKHLATASGDGTVKLWDFSLGAATATYSDHTQAVWSCAFHDLGKHIISGSMDHTAKLWDIQTSKCKYTFRGHVDSVNHVGFVPFSNTLYTCSGDRTLSFWDPRQNVCSQTLFGHKTAINHAVFSPKGSEFASCDADGIIKFWDLRMTKELRHINTGKLSLNKLSFDHSGSVLSAASANGVVRFVIDGVLKGDLKVSEDSCHAVSFDKIGEYLVASGLDGSFKIFQ